MDHGTDPSTEELSTVSVGKLVQNADKSWTEYPVFGMLKKVASLPIPRVIPYYPPMEKLIAQDQQKILACLQKGPLTSSEISPRIRLSVSRVNELLLNLRAQGAVHTSRCAKGSRGISVNLWELRSPTQPQE